MKTNLIYKKILLFSLALLITGCGSGIVGPVQNYTENQAPVIETFASDLTSGSDSITSGTAMTLTVTTSDPENETLKYEFSSDDGSFSSQTSIDNGTEVEFTVGNKVVASQSITVKVTVSDGHKNSVSKTLTVGKTKDSAVVSITSDGTSYVKSTGTKTFTFTASETGTYQVQVQPSGTSSFSFDSSKAQRVYFVGDEITVTVDGSGVSSSNSNAQMTSSSNKIAVVFQDTTGGETYTSFTLTEDDTGPVCQFDSPAATGTYISVDPFTVTFSATDSGCGVSKISYTTNGSTPTFSGSGTVISGSSGTATVGTGGLGSYELKIAAMDELGNIGNTESFSYKIVTETTPPGEAELSVDSYTDHEINLSWTEPSDSDYDHIVLTWTVNGTEAGTVTIPKGTATYKIDTGLDDEDSVLITAHTVDTNGNTSETGRTKSVTMADLPPDELIDVHLSAIGTETMTFSWTLSGDEDHDGVYYIVKNDSGQTVEEDYVNNAPNRSTLGVTGLSPNTSYTLTIMAIDQSQNCATGTTISFTTASTGQTVYTVTDEAGLKAMADDLNGYYILTEDITLTEEWTTIGDSSTPFTGKFLGNGHTITGLTISSTTDSYQGMFGYTDGATVQDIVLKNCSIDSTTTWTGGIVGYADNSSIIKNCSVSGTIKGDGSETGGIVGMSVNSTIQYCSFSGTATAGGNFAGGISGFSAVSTIEFCHSTGTVEAIQYGGGITGLLTSNSTISNCYSLSSVTVSGYSSDYSGGITGSSSSTDTIEYCYYSGTIDNGSGSDTGPITGTDSIGTTLTSLFYNNSLYTDSYSHENITGLPSTTVASDNFFTTHATDWSTLIWARDNSINSGYPYLINNPPQ